MRKEERVTVWGKYYISKLRKEELRTAIVVGATLKIETCIT